MTEQERDVKFNAFWATTSDEIQRIVSDDLVVNWDQIEDAAFDAIVERKVIWATFQPNDETEPDGDGVLDLGIDPGVSVFLEEWTVDNIWAETFVEEVLGLKPSIPENGVRCWGECKLG